MLGIGPPPGTSLKLVGFAVENYRSILASDHMPISDLTVLVGPNNEGKSNILRAVTVALRIASRGPSRGTILRYGHSALEYDWPRDFPVTLQQAQPEGRTIFTLEFELNDLDRKEFQNLLGSKLSANLTLVLSLSKTGEEFEVKIQGPSKQKLTAKREELAKFVAGRIDCEYIGTRRSAEESQDIVDRLLQRELQQLQLDSAYLEARKKLDGLERERFKKVAEKLTNTLREFVPAVKAVEINHKSLESRVRAAEIMVNDGVPTALAQKGDGIQSLAALALMRDRRKPAKTERALILAVEEPESHLHPDAVHALRQVLREISKSQQVILTTHSPILVLRERLGQNIVVQDSKAHATNNIGEIREALGVHVSDNLVGAEVVLLVEGETDARCMRAWLAAHDPKLADALDESRLVIEPLQGVSGLSHRVQLHKSQLTNVHVFIDSDDEGTAALKKAMQSNLLQPNEFHLVKAGGRKQAEFEDLVRIAAYSDLVKNTFQVDLALNNFASGTQKWSRRIERVFSQQGKDWSLVERSVKDQIAEIFCKAPLDSTNAHDIECVRSLAGTLKGKLLE